MAERVEITDQDNGEPWLNAQDRQTRIWFAARCSLRTLPELGTWGEATASGLSISICRANIIAAAAATCSTGKIEALEGAAERASEAVGESPVSLRDFERTKGATGARYAASASSSANSCILPAKKSDGYLAGYTLGVSAQGVRAFTVSDLSAYYAVYTAATHDANAPKSWARLWHDDPPPERLEAAWGALKAQWEADGPHWAFWIEWYEAVLEGKWTNWDLIFKIATTLTDEDWDKSAVHVAERIAEIEADHIVAALPQVNEVFETEDGLYEIRGTILDTSKLMNSLLDRISFALDTAVQSNMCEINEMSLACKILRRALEIGGDDANAMEQYLRRASSLLKSGVESKKINGDEETQFLIEILDEAALQLRGEHPEVAAASNTRLKQRLREIDGETRIKTAILIDELREGTAQRLNAELVLAAEVARDGTSSEATVEAIKESGNVAGKISVLERAKRVEGSGQMAMTKIAMRAQGLVDWVVSLISGG